MSYVQLTADKELLAISIPLAVAFTKHLGQVFLPNATDDGIAEGPTLAEATEGKDTIASAVTSQEKDKFKKLLTAYYDALSRRAVKDHTVSSMYQGTRETANMGHHISATA